MEIYNLYESFILLYAQMNGGVDVLFGNSRPFIIALCVGVGVIGALFFLQAAGLYCMAKKQNLKKRWLAFVPFANVWYIGKLAGPFEVFGHKMRRAGLYTMLAQIATALLCFSSMAAEAYLFIKCADSTTVVNNTLGVQFSGLGRAETAILNYYNISEYIISIVGFVYSVLLLILLMGLYRKYYAKGYMLLSWLGIFVPMSRYIVIFVLRNNQAIDYNEYLRKKREAYARRYGNMGGYGNPYGNPYGNNRGAYGAPNGNPYGERPKPEEPFSEFGNGGDANGTKGERAGTGGENGGSGKDTRGDSDDLFD